MFWHHVSGHVGGGEGGLYPGSGPRLPSSTVQEAAARRPDPGCQRSQSAQPGLQEVGNPKSLMFQSETLDEKVQLQHTYPGLFVSVSGKELIQSAGARLRLLVVRSPRTAAAAHCLLTLQLLGHHWCTRGTKHDWNLSQLLCTMKWLVLNAHFVLKSWFHVFMCATVFCDKRRLNFKWIKFFFKTPEMVRWSFGNNLNLTLLSFLYEVKGIFRSTWHSLERWGHEKGSSYLLKLAFWMTSVLCKKII